MTDGITFVCKDASAEGDASMEDWCIATFGGF